MHSATTTFNKNQCFGEVVEAGIDQLVVQYWQDSKAATFGEIIKLQSPWGTAFALLYDLKNTAIFPHSKAVALQLTPEELASQQPQLADVIATFAWLKVFAYRNQTQNTIIFNYAPQPVPLHTFAAHLDPVELLTLTELPLFFLQLLHSISAVAEVERVALALVDELARHKPLTLTFFEDLYQQYSRIPGFNQAQARLLFSQFNSLVKSHR